jgi:tellurite resistance-related uncharacterized protein
MATVSNVNIWDARWWTFDAEDALLFQEHGDSFLWCLLVMVVIIVASSAHVSSIMQGEHYQRGGAPLPVLPGDVRMYHRMPDNDYFNNQQQPPTLLSSWSYRTWVRIVVIEGRLRVRYKPQAEAPTATFGDSQPPPLQPEFEGVAVWLKAQSLLYKCVLPPTVDYELELLSDNVEYCIEMYKAKGVGDDDE